MPVGELEWHFAHGSPPVWAKVVPQAGVLAEATPAAVPLLWQYIFEQTLDAGLNAASVAFFAFSDSVALGESNIRTTESLPVVPLPDPPVSTEAGLLNPSSWR